MNAILLPKHVVPCSPLPTSELLVQREVPGEGEGRTYPDLRFERRLAAIRRNVPPMVRHSPVGIALTCFAVGWILGRSLVGSLHR